MFTRKVPYNRQEPFEVLLGLIKNKQQWKIDERIPEPLYSLLLKCQNYDQPQKRPNALDIMETVKLMMVDNPLSPSSFLNKPSKQRSEMSTEQMMSMELQKKDKEIKKKD